MSGAAFRTRPWRLELVTATAFSIALSAFLDLLVLRRIAFQVAPVSEGALRCSAIGSVLLGVIFARLVARASGGSWSSSVLDGLVGAALLLTAAGTLLPSFREDLWVLGLASHARLYLGAAALAFSAFAYLTRRRWRARVFAALLLTNTVFLWPYRPRAAASVRGATVMAVTTWNVNRYNDHPELAEAFLREDRPDIAILHETTPAFAGALRLNDLYPFRISVDHPNAFGTVILSRHEVTDHDVMRHGRLDIPVVSARVATPVGSVRVLTTHAPSPKTRALARERDHLLQFLARLVRAEPTLVAGDFNATPWSAPLRPLARDAGLRSARGFVPTWPARLHVLGLPIDHVYVSSHFRVLGVRGKNVPGSDHRALTVRITVERSVDATPDDGDRRRGSR